MGRVGGGTDSYVMQHGRTNVRMGSVLACGSAGEGHWVQSDIFGKFSEDSTWPVLWKKSHPSKERWALSKGI